MKPGNSYELIKAHWEAHPAVLSVTCRVTGFSGGVRRETHSIPKAEFIKRFGKKQLPSEPQKGIHDGSMAFHPDLL
jgi:hypothetical protein